MTGTGSATTADTATAAGTATTAIRAVVTGLGVVAPTGVGTERHWKSTLTSASGISELASLAGEDYPARLAGQVPDFDAARLLPGRLLPQTDVSTRFALVAAAEALADAAVDTAKMHDYDMGVVTSNAAGGFDFTHREFNKLWAKGPRHVSVYESFAWFYAVSSGQISIRHGMRGPSAALVGEQAGGLDALGYARRSIGLGTPLILSGGADSALDPWGYAAQLSTGRVSGVADPCRAYLPFTAEASGHLPGEGAAMLIVEDANAARERGAPQIYGEIAGHAATFDPPPGSPRPPGLARAARAALAAAGAAPCDVDVVFADAAGVPELDRREAEALTELFGPRGVPVTAPKTLTGRLHSAGGPLDVVSALLAMRDGVIPATPGPVGVREDYGLDLVADEPRGAAIRVALVLARGRWGFNSAVVLRSAA